MMEEFKIYLIGKHWQRALEISFSMTNEKYVFIGIGATHFKVLC